MKTVSSIIILALTAAILSGCSYIKRGGEQPSQAKICSQLRQQLIFQTNTFSPNQLPATPTQNADRMKDYYHYNCDELEPNPVEGGDFNSN